MNVGPLTGVEEDRSAPTGDVKSGDARPAVRKAPNAFRTISEVADDLHIPQHVLRFWETKFPQVKPLKRGGGRRYYRPDDIALLRQISDLLYIQGYTIKGVQRLLREGGGKLSDDIPPPAPEEKAGADHVETDDPQLAMPGLPPAVSAPRVRARADVVKLEGHEDTARVAALVDDVRLAADSAEIARLRSLLRETLHELEALRALLG
jgi:DNA-binding transcriptional MerR regulator